MIRIVTVAAVIALTIVPVLASEGHRERGENHQERGDSHHGEYRSDFYGDVKKMPEKGFVGMWQVGEKKVRVSETTRVKEKRGAAKPGCYVEVKGEERNGIVDAYEIEVKRRK